MFQNVEDNDNYDENEENNKTIKLRLKELFKIQNIIIYILTLMVSCLTIKNIVAPFGLAMIAACIGEGVPIIGVVIMAIIGTFISAGIKSVLSMVLILVIFFALLFLFRGKVAVEERNELYKVGGKLFGAHVIVLIFKKLFGKFVMYDLLMGLVSASLIYVYYKIFVNGLSSIKNLGIKKAFSTEEFVALVIMISVAIVSLNMFTIGDYNVSRIVLLAMTMILAYTNGFGAGIITSAASCLSISLIQPMYLPYIIIMISAALIAALLKRVGKMGTLIVFVLGNLYLYKFGINSESLTIYIQEMLFASITLLITPGRVRIDLETFFDKDRLITTSGIKWLEGEIPGKSIDDNINIKTISEMFNELVNRPDKKEMAEFEVLVQDLLDGFEEIKENIFYDVISKEETLIAKDICTILKTNNLIIDNDLIKIFNDHNNYVVLRDENIRNDLQEVVKISNRVYKNYHINKVKEEEKQKAERLKIANELSSDEKKGKKKEAVKSFQVAEKEIENTLNEKNLKVKKVEISKLLNEKHMIKLDIDYIDIKAGEKDTITCISDLISKIIGSKVTYVKDRKDDIEKTYTQYYSSEDKFILQVGSSKVTKDEHEHSAEFNLQTKLPDGKYLFVISDGNGDGDKARECGKIALRIIKQIMAKGFDGIDTLELLSSKLDVLEQTDMYAYTNIVVMDLFVGKMYILKNSNNQIYFKSKKTITKVSLKDTVNNMQIGTRDVTDGDMILMCSDGLETIDEMENKDWVKEFIKNITTNNVQKIADQVLSKQVENTMGVITQDASVIVTKVVGKK